MEGISRIQVRLDILAQEMISQYMVHNQEIGKEIEAGIKLAFENFDVKGEVAKSVRQTLDSTIRHSTSWGKLDRVVAEKLDALLSTYADAAVEKFKKEFPELTPSIKEK